MREYDTSQKAVGERKTQERRAAPRLKTRIKVNFLLDDDKEEKWKHAYTVDISSSGMSFIYSNFIPLRSQLKVRIAILRLKEEVIVIAKIIRIEDLGARGYLYGLQYENIKPEIQEMLKKKLDLLDLDKLLSMVAEQGASDLHLCINTQPLIRVGGRLKKIDSPPLTRVDLEEMLCGIMTEEQEAHLAKYLELDSSYVLDNDNRFRFNIHFQRCYMEATFRRIYTERKTLKELGLPEIVSKFALSKSGLVVITGMTNNGKTTTAATMIDLINEKMDKVILTVEDPIEHIQLNNKSVIKKREVGLDTKSFAIATREALRQDIDVLFIGEILDPDTLLVALRAAEVGHLVIVTFPAQDCTQAIERMIFSVQPHLQYQVKMQLSSTLLGIIAQALFPSAKDPSKRAVATEILVNTPGVANAIRDGNFFSIRTAIQTGMSFGMHTMKSSVELLCAQQAIPLDSIKELEDKEQSNL